jgi:3-oxoadipate enol-lactonase
MPVCEAKGININYCVFGKGFPLVLIHPFSASWEFWLPQIKKLSAKYKIIAYDVRGHGLSSAPAGEENYTLEILADDLHHLLTHLNIAKAYIGGLSLGGAVALGYAHRHLETVKALLVFDIHGGFMPPSNPAVQAAMSEGRIKGENYARERGMADFARLQLFTGSAFPPVPDDEAQRQYFIERMARFPINGYIGVGRAKPWEAEWQRQAADKIQIPTLITVGDKDLEMVVKGTRTLHEHIQGSRYVIIRNSVHETARWQPILFTRCVSDFLKDVEAGKPVAGEFILG